MKVAALWALVIPLAAAGPTSLSLWKREATWGKANGASVASSAICSDDKVKILKKTMGEVAALAKAGSDGLAHMADFISSDATAQARFNALEDKEKLRVKETYGVFFGQVTEEKKGDWAPYISRIKSILDRIKDLTAETWPSTVRIYCDSSYDQDTDPDGKTWDQVDGIKDNPAAQGRVWKYDYDLQRWASREVRAACRPGNPPAAFTLAQPDLSKDRITFCPEWFKLAAEPAAGPAFSDMTSNDITFARKTARVFFHEHLHTWTFNQGPNKADFLDDVQGDDSYSWSNVARLANGGPLRGQTTAADVPAANRNIESVVYWCIAMYWDKWYWQSGKAQPLSNV